MNNKKIIFRSIILFMIVGFVVLYNALDITNYKKKNALEEENFLNRTLKAIVPQSIKNYAKDTIFIFKKASILEQQLEDKNNEYLDLLNHSMGYAFIKKDVKNKKLGNIKLSLKTFNLPLLKTKGPRSYLAYDDQNLFLITGTGVLMYASLDNLNDEKLVFKVIDTNFEDLAGKDYIEYGKGIVKHILVKNNKIYLSYGKKVNDECYTSAILVSNIELERITFNEFFDMKECQSLFTIQAGGNLSDYKDNKILMTIGAYHSYEQQNNDNPQNMNSLVGKTISIDENTKESKILSMGHRNSQGIYYDKENNIIYSTDHGPQGGDEINIDTSPGENVKNYGWAISSYGEHYGFPEKKNSELYKVAPLNKSHKKYGFTEPLKYFVPSIAITQIIKTEEFIKIPNKNIIYVGALGNNIKEGDRSIHQFVLDDNLIIEQHNIMPINERIRDMVYIAKLNKIFLFLETSGSIGILEIDN